MVRGFLAIMVTIAVANQKGGVGKTTIAFNLAQIVSSKPKTRVLAIDNDPQGNLTSSFLEDPAKLEAHVLDAYDEKPFMPAQISNSLYLLGSNLNLALVAERRFAVVLKLKQAIASLKTEKFDYVVIDCSPSFGYLHLAALNAADYVLIPVKPAPYALAGLKDLFDTISKAKKYYNPKIKVLGIVVNLVDGRKVVIEREMEQVLRKTYGNLVLKSRIHKRVKVEESPAFQQPVTVYDPWGPAAREFRSMADEILQRIKKSGRQGLAKFGGMK
jgi:chromosome partitioning protein